MLDGIQVRVHRIDLPAKKYIPEQIGCLHEDVLHMLLKLLRRTLSPDQLATKALCLLGLFRN